jgi:hypothetical protein
MAERMIRTQFYLEPEVNQALEELAARLQVSKAELIRQGIRRILEEESPVEGDPLLGIVGLGGGGPGNVSEEHDRYLADVKLGKGRP